ncbi:MAG: hypothetical protein QT11_C0001G0303 [archaeon GW2011_AR20]|nr:MAG: hypothetical protein QT11_C0001G0303 [archaeon GW2011_AR20]AQS28471.1 hypothetical protein [uncultured archaeon]MBS3160310.1 AbrB/MazE/SpoVT family DNA-binding domain-containing protein [Candidatus Woesearchaeota archaeon]
MRLQKRFSSKYKDKEYYKYQVNIPEEEIRKAQLKEGDKLDIETEKHKIILKKVD